MRVNRYVITAILLVRLECMTVILAKKTSISNNVSSFQMMTSASPSQLTSSFSSNLYGQPPVSSKYDVNGIYMYLAWQPGKSFPVRNHKLNSYTSQTSQM